MKACSWCGHESPDEATCCPQCGTALVDKPKDAKPPQQGDWSWIKGALGYIGATLLFVFVYLLSLVQSCVFR